MDQQQELKHFIERASQRVEAAFDRVGRILPMYHILFMDGQEVVMPPPTFLRDKDAAMTIMRVVFATRATRRYVFIDEAWMVAEEDQATMQQAIDCANSPGGLADHPLRTEVVVFNGEDCQAGMLMGLRSIERPAGGKPYLGPLKIDERTSHYEGRMVGLLPAVGAMQ